ncbi:MAG: gluconate 2-dehydrogenase subunit 3 family protein [Chitinophagaceae bacterium]
MNRRNAIRNVVVISAGATLLPSCLRQDKSALSLKNLSITSSQEKMLAELTETIIPKTPAFIGAKDLRSHEFVLTMVDDCTSPEEHKKFTNGMQSFEEACKKKWDKDFEKCTPEQRTELIQMIEKKQEIPEDAANFYGTVKRYTLQSFTTSKEYMVDIRKYKLVPGGNYKGCVPVKKA